jgi:rhamnogalacturonan hydrolase
VKPNPGSTLYVPAGSYNMQTWVTLNAASTWAFRLDGFITRTGALSSLPALRVLTETPPTIAATTGGHMIIVENANDFEMYSSTSAGGFQGHGYECRNTGPRFLRVVKSNNWSVHDLVFVDSPEFHFVIDHSNRGEVYNLAIRGADIGGSDGVDVTGTNIWVGMCDVSTETDTHLVCRFTTSWSRTATSA